MSNDEPNKMPDNYDPDYTPDNTRLGDILFQVELLQRDVSEASDSLNTIRMNVEIINDLYDKNKSSYKSYFEDLIHSQKNIEEQLSNNYSINERILKSLQEIKEFSYEQTLLHKGSNQANSSSISTNLFRVVVAISVVIIAFKI